MTRTGLLWCAAAALTIIISGCSDSTKPRSPEEPAARPGAVGTGGAGANVREDDDFVRDVALKNMAEIELSRLALNRALNSQIKSFAQTMIDDHDAAGNKLKSAAAAGSIGWPSELDDKHRENADELAKKQGADFDRDYVKAMVESHQDLTAKLESRLDVQSLQDWKTAAAGRTRDKSLPEPGTEMRDVKVRPDKSERESTRKINQWAADTYPVAQKHLDAARTLENAIRKPSSH
jgi:predicted outer membrane protein